MKNNFIKTGRHRCPHCHTTQTAFLYSTREPGDAVALGFNCVKCGNLVKGNEYFESANLTVGDIKP